ncbi:MAG: LacI family transcriptional regulator [Oscillospiraceae bacterium]|nr:LacI family transcriptional regulator [Oscillospiraceae bacterium]
MATMDDIARRLGISRGTVSKALSGAADVSETMRKSVVETAVELGYSRISRTGESRRVCVFVENMAYEKPEDFGWEIITGFRKLAEPGGYQVDIVPLTEELQRSIPYDEYMLRSGYQGSLFLGLSLLDPWMADFRTCAAPTVLYDNQVRSNPAVTQVGIDNIEGMDLAVARLKELGHRKVGYLSTALGSYIYQARYAAFFHALRQNKLPAQRELAGYAFRLTECLEKHLPRLLDRGCTAIICSHDLLAHMLLIHCLELGISVPGQLSVIGFDDLPLCQYTIPPLSTVRQNRTELGKSAFYALSSLIERTPISTLLLHAELVERRSAGPGPDRETTEQQ